MTVSHLTDKRDLPTLELADFPPCKLDRNTSVTLQVAEQLKRLLERYGQGAPASLRIPSALVLGDFYGTSILDILDALLKLKAQHYEYVMHGLDASIILHDPLCRKKPDKKARVLSPPFRQAWNPVNKVEGA